MTKLAIIRIRGQVRNNGKRHKAMILLNLKKKFSVIITEDNPIIRSQIKIITPDITWGEATDDIIKILTQNFPKQTIYNLNPPKGGLGRKGVKTAYSKKGAYGYRGQKINDLLKKMM